ncbi:metallopeptidase TldD-related protein [uncultured Clostridium sp.]|uniref:metallopeptidase TldD-related protein n=1 Tax=uncultured Clostridium sp. TaxID=59620 RepID=UPI00321741DF
MGNREIALYCIDNIVKQGADKSQCILKSNKKYELNFGNEDITLLRTTIDTNIDLVAIKDDKKSTITLNKLEEEAINTKIKELMEMCESAESDQCNDIAEEQPKEEFSSGASEPDLDKMYEFTSVFLKKLKEEFPQVKFSDGTTLEFNSSETNFLNSNGVDFKIVEGIYRVDIGFLAKEGEKSTSFTGFSYLFNELPLDFMEYADVRQRFKDIVSQLNCERIKDKFIGDIILTPELVVEMLYYYNINFLGDRSLIGGTSILKDKLNEKVANHNFTVKCMPLNDEIANKSFVTKDGYKTENISIIENGILKSFIIGLYAAKKIGKPVTKTDFNIVVDNGDKSIEDIIKSTKKGIILGRFSGDMPASNGDFSGVAKNSFYVENGEIKYAITETMITSNLKDMFNNIEEISIETLNTGESVTPWMKIKDVTISGN